MLICLISYILTKRDIFSPPVAFSGVFIVSIIVAIFNLKSWNFNMGERTFGVVLLGVGFFCIGFFCIYFLKQKTTYNLRETSLLLNNIYIKKYKLVLFFLLQLLTLYLFYRDFSIIVSNMGGAKDLSDSIVLFRLNTSMDNNSGEVSSLVSNLMVMSKVSIYFFSYCFWYEYFTTKKKKFIYLLFLIIPMILGCLQGGRETIINIILTFFIIMYVLWLTNNNWKKTVSLKLFCLISSILILFLVIFSSIGLLILGREEQFEKASSNIVDNIWNQISIYIGAPLKLLDLYMYTDYGTNSMTGGLSTFRNVYRFLGNHFEIAAWNLSTNFGEEARIDNTKILGNVYTMFRSYVQDFDYIGLIVLMLLVGIIMGYIYFLIKYNQSKHIINFNIMLYSLLFVCIIEGFFADIFFRTLFSTYFIKFIFWSKIFEWGFLSFNKPLGIKR